MVRWWVVLGVVGVLPGVPGAAASGASVTVGWERNHAALADGFVVLRRDGSGKFVSLGVVSVAGDTRFSDDEVAAGVTYTYAVRAMNSAWNGNESTTVPITIPSCK